jgi:hypothetical protein
MEMHQVPMLGRCCFICLDDEGELISCCSRCYGVSHSRCWKEWRNSQRNSASRRRPGSSIRLADPFLCSICKTGRARLIGETVTRDWIEVVLSATINSESGNSEIDMFEDIEDDPFSCCSRKILVTNFILVTLVTISTVILAVFEKITQSHASVFLILVFVQLAVFNAVWLMAERRRIWRNQRRLNDQEIRNRITELVT